MTDDNTMRPEDADRVRYKLESAECVVNNDGEVVCSHCMGNCGQCGITDIVGCIPPKDWLKDVKQLTLKDRENRSRYERWVQDNYPKSAFPPTIEEWKQLVSIKDITTLNGGSVSVDASRLSETKEWHETMWPTIKKILGIK